MAKSKRFLPKKLEDLIDPYANIAESSAVRSEKKWVFLDKSIDWRIANGAMYLRVIGILAIKDELFVFENRKQSLRNSLNSETSDKFDINEEWSCTIIKEFDSLIIASNI